MIAVQSATYENEQTELKAEVKKLQEDIRVQEQQIQNLEVFIKRVKKYITLTELTPYALTDTFMGFHCGNTPACKLCADRAVKYQLIQNRLLENGGEPDFTRDALEGDTAPSDITFYRLQCDSFYPLGATLS